MKVKLKVLKGKNEGKEIAVPVKRFLIGRADDCHMRPKSDAISRNHSAILINDDDDDVVVRDLNSRNGTFVNGQRISQDTSLVAGDHLQMGRLEFEVIIKGRKPVPEPVAAPMGDANDSGSLDFDVSDWLDEADAADKAERKSDPETRQFKLDETDRIALEEAKRTLDSVDEDALEAAAEAQAVVKSEKKKPGKLPESAKPQAATSRDAAEQMLKKFFNNR
jgi:pSer/pThr/pTyr-binding forkhead associated (FHA) protein